MQMTSWQGEPQYKVNYISVVANYLYGELLF